MHTANCDAALVADALKAGKGVCEHLDRIIWDGDGIDEVGLHRSSSGLFYWRNTLTTGIADGEIFFGDPGDWFIAGDWGMVDGKDTPAVFRPSDTTFYFRHTFTQGLADSQFQSGRSRWLPVAGRCSLG